MIFPLLSPFWKIVPNLRNLEVEKGSKMRFLEENESKKIFFFGSFF